MAFYHLQYMISLKNSESGEMCVKKKQYSTVLAVVGLLRRLFSSGDHRMRSGILGKTIVCINK